MFWGIWEGGFNEGVKSRGNGGGQRSGGALKSFEWIGWAEWIELVSSKLMIGIHL